MSQRLLKSGIAILAAGPTLLLMGAGAPSKLASDARQYFKPLPTVTVPAGETAKVDLGRQLFFEPRLSASGAISCNSCHNLATYGVDNLPTSFGHNFQKGGRNSPTVFNAGLHIAQFWDGRAKDLAAQAKGPILNPVEMAMPNAAAVETRLKSIPGYVSAFRKAFPKDKEPVTYDNMANAIARFESTLVTPARFDKFLQGDSKALNAAEQRGLRQFMDKGCIACHNGATVGGQAFMKFGSVKPYINQKDLGRFEVTHAEADKYVFKVPSLRNITRTYPYFHDGAVADLPEAIRTMGETQLGLKLTPAEIGDIAAFLGSLEGTLPKSAQQLPVLPAAGPRTARLITEETAPKAK
jgi:cytochrome c peroxidase